jgi:hypothetical protein
MRLAMVSPMDWSFLPTLAQGQEPLVLDETGDFDSGDGMRATLFPHHLLLQVKTPNREAHLLLPLTDILDAIAEMTQEIGS